MLTLQMPGSPPFPQSWDGQERVTIPLTKVSGCDHTDNFLSIKMLKPYDFLSNGFSWCKKNALGSEKKGKREELDYIDGVRGQSALLSLVLMFSQEHTTNWGRISRNATYGFTILMSTG